MEARTASALMQRHCRRHHVSLFTISEELVTTGAIATLDVTPMAELGRIATPGHPRPQPPHPRPTAAVEGSGDGKG